MTTASKENALLMIGDVSKAYGQKLILDNVDLRVRKGELCTLVGPSGCGKSTLLRLILGQERCTSGAILLDGKPIGFANSDRGIVYQRYSLFPHLSVIDNVLLGKRLTTKYFQWRNNQREYRDEAILYLEKVRLEKHLDKYPHELSGGMQQRVAIVQALIMQPKILLMDEPFGALDPETREDAQLFLLELWEETAMTIFFVTHDLDEACFLGSRLFALSQFYMDDRGEGTGINRGAKLVKDYNLGNKAFSSEAKQSKEFNELIVEIRQEAFEPGYLQHVKEFDLSHPDSFQTLTEEEYNEQL